MIATIEKERLQKLEMQLGVLREVAQDFPTSTITNVIQQKEALAKEIRKRIQL